jgi:hypothetical protein
MLKPWVVTLFERFDMPSFLKGFLRGALEATVCLLLVAIPGDATSPTPEFSEKTSSSNAGKSFWTVAGFVVSALSGLYGTRSCHRRRWRGNSLALLVVKARK